MALQTKYEFEDIILSDAYIRISKVRSLKANLKDAISELRANMKFIIQQASYGHNE